MIEYLFVVLAMVAIFGFFVWKWYGFFDDSSTNMEDRIQKIIVFLIPVILLAYVILGINWWVLNEWM